MVMNRWCGQLIRSHPATSHEALDLSGLHHESGVRPGLSRSLGCRGGRRPALL